MASRPYVWDVHANWATVLQGINRYVRPALDSKSEITVVNGRIIKLLS